MHNIPHTEETKRILSMKLKGRMPINPFPKGSIPWNKGKKTGVKPISILSDISLGSLVLR